MLSNDFSIISLYLSLFVSPIVALPPILDNIGPSHTDYIEVETREIDNLQLNHIQQRNFQDYSFLGRIFNKLIDLAMYVAQILDSIGIPTNPFQHYDERDTPKNRQRSNTHCHTPHPLDNGPFQVIWYWDWVPRNRTTQRIFQIRNFAV